ncbi:sigma-70 family RNA polymerase sigma factor [Paracoccus versutus]|uniref:RNA polymerase sigma factor (Sigma-70 family) n=1 Tax=Paracoccus versutus TaxID=34007 RepID=A0AAQ0KML8_PARVE|nr:sigma-70 family RNA polymerase sigma factor [Paracoccus versutus]KGJ11897.1 flagellar biosynthesis protein FliA [Paracoccus versutus]REG54117.1 RNA polymerase sigma factor (sigma-70 family) [Paracoccus versutus]WEJ79305.1 sigma-70 family RNA polymerase sigma factor [Paracoccus versutus]
MEVIRAFRNLDRHGQQRAPEVIEEEVRQLEPHLGRFREELVRLEVVASQTKGKTRIQVSLRLQLPSGMIAAQEEGFEIEPALRKAFADLRHRVDRHVARLKHEPEYKRPARRRRIGAPLAPARDAAEAERRQLFFDLIEDHLDTVYDTVRRELTYLECSGSVPAGYLSVGDIVDATILKGLARFEDRPSEFSVGDWLKRLAFETIEEESRAARRAVPEDAASIEAEPEAPAEDPTEADQAMIEFYQPDEVLMLEDLIADDGGTDPETEVDRHKIAMALHRAIADLAPVERRVLYRMYLEDATIAETADLFGLTETEVAEIAENAGATLRARLAEAGSVRDPSGRAPIEREIAHTQRLPQPIEDRRRLAAALTGEEAGSDT